MSSGSVPHAHAAAAALVLVGWSMGACATRGHLATPNEMARLKQARGLSASGRLTLSSPRGKFSARAVFGVARPDSLRIEIPSGAGLRFLLVARDGRLRADLPEDDAMFEGPGTGEIMSGLFGINVEPRDVVAALLGSSPESMTVLWRFKNSRPAQVILQGSNGAKLSLTVDDPEIESPADEAFTFGPPRAHSWTVEEMSDRLGLSR